MTASVFAAVQMAPRDPILGVTETFNADMRTHRFAAVDLEVDPAHGFYVAVGLVEILDADDGFGHGRGL